MLHLYSASNPRRPVDWRWQRAQSILAGGYPLSRKRDDEWVAKAVRFLRAYSLCTAEIEFVELSERTPEVFWAYHIWTAVDMNEGNPFKSEIEARLLSGDDQSRVARRLVTTPEVVAMYERLFFNINERRDCDAYVMHQVLGPALHTGLQEHNYDLIWKFLGYVGGPYVLDAATVGLINPSRPTSANDVQAFFGDMAKSAIIRKALVAILTLRLNNFNATETLAQFLKLAELDSLKKGASGALPETYSNQIMAMFRALPVRARELGALEDPAQAAYSNQGIELRYDAQLALAAGHALEPPGGIGFEKYVYPDPPTKDPSAGTEAR